MSPDVAVQRAAEDNLTALEQGRELLASLDAAAYGRRVPECFNSSMGGHMRHVLDHYESLFAGLVEREVDYEARTRDRRTETDPKHALGLIAAISKQLSALNQDAALAVRAETSGTETPVRAASSLLRELEFSLSHTVHHFALIAVIAGLCGKRTPENFGMAPSTLRHLAAARG